MKTQTQKPLTLVRLEVNNIMRLSGTVEIVPNGEVITITGANRAGKSSLINAIAMLFGGSENMPERPLHTGASRGHILGDLDDIVVTRKFTTAGAPSLTITSKNGDSLKSPQTLLDSLWNKMLDPVKFIRLSDTPEGRRKQAEILRNLVNLDFTDLDGRRKKAYDDRTLASRDLTVAKGKLVNFPADGTAPKEEISVRDLLEKLQAAQEQNRKNQTIRKTADDIRSTLADQKSECATLSQTIEDIEKMLKEKKGEREDMLVRIGRTEHDLNDASANVSALNDVDEKLIQDQIAKADETNVKVRGNRRRAEITKEISGHQKKVDSLTAEMDQIDKHKQKQLADANFPLPGLSFDESGILLDGEPFAQGSSAEQTKAAMAIGIALNPPIHVILIRGGNDLDDDSLAEVRKIAAERGYQVWIETIRTNDPAAIVLEDGELKGEN
jgi:hypothetical protein